MSLFNMLRMLLLPNQGEKELADSLRKLKTLKVSDRGGISISPSEVWEDNRKHTEEKVNAS